MRGVKRAYQRNSPCIHFAYYYVRI